MSADAGEQIVGCYLQRIEKCDFVSYNVKLPHASQSELDVIGLRLNDKRVFLCEVAVHLGGFNYGKGSASDIAKVRNKYEAQKHYAAQHLTHFDPVFMFWAPFFPKKGKVLEAIHALDGLKLVTNEEFNSHVQALREDARMESADIGNDFFRFLQIIGRL